MRGRGESIDRAIVLHSTQLEIAFVDASKQDIEVKGHIICETRVCFSLVPRPHPRGGKGSGELGQNPWACAEEFPRANEIVALAQSYDKLTAGMQHRYTYRVAIQFR